MTYREVSVIEVKEILRLWLEGRSLREVTRLAAADRKTVRRYVEAAQAAGLDRDDGLGRLDDELLSAVIAAVRPDRPRGTGASWETIARRTLMMAQSTCSPAEYRRMLHEKAGAAMETAKLLSAPYGASAEALLKPWHSRATANAKRLRKT